MKRKKKEPPKPYKKKLQSKFQVSICEMKCIEMKCYEILDLCC